MLVAVTFAGPWSLSVELLENMAGPVHSKFTSTGMFTAELNSTVQVKLTVEFIGVMGLRGLLITDTKVGDGTGWIR